MPKKKKLHKSTARPEINKTEITETHKFITTPNIFPFSL